jgi:hypothetical protein
MAPPQILHVKYLLIKTTHRKQEQTLGIYCSNKQTFVRQQHMKAISSVE